MHAADDSPCETVYADTRSHTGLSSDRVALRRVVVPGRAGPQPELHGLYMCMDPPVPHIWRVVQPAAGPLAGLVQPWRPEQTRCAVELEVPPRRRPESPPPRCSKKNETLGG